MGKRIGSQRRGQGSALYRSPSHRHLGEVTHPKVEDGVGTVENIVHSPGHTVPVADILLQPSGMRFLMLAPSGLKVGQKVFYGSQARIAPGNTLHLGSIPEGTPIYNIEAKPRDGGKFARAGGTSAYVVSQGKMTTVRLPSGAFKNFKPTCRATIGVLAGGGRTDKPFAKSGKKFYAYQSKAKAYLKVKGIAMNPVNHPHGGGNHPHVGVPSTVSRNAPPGRKVGRLSPKKRSKK